MDKEEPLSLACQLLTLLLRKILHLPMPGVVFLFLLFDEIILKLSLYFPNYSKLGKALNCVDKISGYNLALMIIA